jgi:hypothetical protein
MSRNYRKERDDYHSKPEQMVRNAARKRARRWMEKEGKAKAGDGKDVHHKDNNPLNNDKNNLSLVTQHYNRREPRLREWEDAAEGALDKLEGQYFRNKVAQIIQVSGRNDTAGLETKIMYQSSDAMRKSTRAFQLHFQKQRSSRVKELIAKAVNKVMDKKSVFFVWDAPFAKIITAFGEDVQESFDTNAAKKMIGLMQKYINTTNKKQKVSLLKDINKLQLKLGLEVTEDMGTVTGPHIAGTGDDSSTVKVRKRKKVRRRKTESRMSPSMRDWEDRNQLAKQIRQKFWQQFKKDKKKNVNVKFKLKNSKSLRKRVIDNVLAIQQKV